MYVDKIKPIPNYSIESDFSANGKIVSVLNFLESNLYAFSLNFQIKNDTDEWKLNKELFCFLDINSRNMSFQFIPEYRNKNKSKPDFGIKEVKTDGNGFFVYDSKSILFYDIECKRLYNPENKQYVQGKTGGIQRFRENKHGIDLPYSAMIGYVETMDFIFRHNKVNSWILNPNEHLELIENKEIAKLKSEHKRISPQNSVIKLTHFWLKMNFVNNCFITTQN